MTKSTTLLRSNQAGSKGLSIFGLVNPKHIDLDPQGNVLKFDRCLKIWVTTQVGTLVPGDIWVACLKYPPIPVQRKADKIATRSAPEDTDSAHDT